MNIIEYYKTIRASIQKRMPDVILRMEKGPGGRTCISISREGEKVSPLFCLEDYHDRYLNGRPLEETIQDILHDWKDFLNLVPDISKDDIYNWEKAKHKIFLTLVAEKGFRPEGRLTRNWLDMELTVRYCISFENGTLQSFPVSGRLAGEYWNIPEKEIFCTAGKNTETFFSPSLKSLYQILSGYIFADKEKEAHSGEAEIIYGNGPLEDSLYVLSNCHNLYGATAICYQGLLAGLYRRFGRPFYIIPCSIHETLLYPEPEDGDREGPFSPKNVREVIFNVNRNNVQPRERLSDSLYYYDGQKLTIAGTGGNDDE